MTTFADTAKIAEDPTFIRRVRQAAVRAAANVQSEPPETPGHEARSKFALAVLTLPNDWARTIAVGVANNPNVGGGVSDPSGDSKEGDSALEFVVASLWDAYSGC